MAYDIPESFPIIHINRFYVKELWGVGPTNNFYLKLFYIIVSEEYMIVIFN